MAEMSPRSANHLPTIENTVNIKLSQKGAALLPWEEVHRTEFVTQPLNTSLKTRFP